MTFAITRWVPHGWTAAILGLIVVVLLAAFVRFDGLGTPDTFIADEGFYAPDGCLYVLSSHQCDRSAEASSEHPPLGKWLIGLGIKATSFTPQGWRTAPAIAGTLTVALVFLLALRLFGSAGYATFTGALLALDPLHIVQSRIATLDVFVTLFGVAAVLFAVLDYQHPSERLAPAWRLAAGVAAGAAVASKWSGVLALAVVVVLCLARPGSHFTRKLASAVITLGLVPLAVYVLTFAGRVHGKLLARPLVTWQPDSCPRSSSGHHVARPDGRVRAERISVTTVVLAAFEAAGGSLCLGGESPDPRGSRDRKSGCLVVRVWRVGRGGDRVRAFPWG